MGKLTVLPSNSITPFVPLDKMLKGRQRKPKDKYAVHSMFLTVQGEGLHVGRRAVFVRFTGCNVWSGVEKHRERDSHNSPCALICDTEFKGCDRENNGGVYTRDQLVMMAGALWGSMPGEAMVVFTGGEPGLQLDAELIAAFRCRNFYTAVETNGTCELPYNVHWATVSPKFPMPIYPRQYDELKLLSIFLDSGYYRNWAEMISATFRWIQPVDFGIEKPEKTAAEIAKSIQFVLSTPGWRLGAQLHKLWGVQ